MKLKSTWFALILTLVAGSLVTGTATVVWAQDAELDVVLARSVELELSGEPNTAAQLLLPLVKQYPQDFTLILRMGWLTFLATSYTESAGYYAQALELNPQSPDALLGLAWCDMRLGNLQSAKQRFQAVLVLRPDDPSALQGLELCDNTGFRVWSDLFFLTFVRHPYRSQAAGGALAASLFQPDSWSLSGVYRGSTYFGSGKTGVPGDWAQQNFDQHEIFAGAGIAGDSYNAEFRYGWLTNSAGDLESTHVVGLVGWAQWGGRLHWDTSLSIYEDGNVWRAALNYAIPLASWLEMTPGLAGQVVLGRLLGNASLGFGGSSGPVAWTVGGRYGPEERVAYSDLWVVYNSTDRFTLGGWAGMNFDVGLGLRLGLSYEARAIATASQGLGQSKGNRSAWMHAFILNLGWEL